METANLKKWIQLFDENHYEKVGNEPEELTNVIILLYAIQNEFKKVETILKNKFQSLKAKYKNYDAVKYDIEKLNNSQVSPKIEVQESSVTSPVLNKHRSIKKKRGSKNCVSSIEKENLKRKCINSCPSETTFSEDDVFDSTVIGITPNVKLVKKNKKLKFQKTKSTNTFYNNTPSTQVLSITTEVKKVDSSSSSMMDIDEILEKVEQENVKSTSFTEEDSLNNTFLDYDKIPTSKKNPSEPKHNFKEIIRGNQKKKLKGWSCKECEKFYSAMNLPEAELIKKMNECSKHRSRFKPDEDTIPGFWDMSIPPTPEEHEKFHHTSAQESSDNDSTIFNFY